MPQKSKTDFLRGVREFNPSAYGKPGTAQEVARLKAKIDDYDAQSGGTWNYDSLLKPVSLACSRQSPP